ncbi:MAG: hypothetical protein GX456_07910 [Verrucomicrobia bacterium]|nr:hypothetical protein [Verrucomicrobiota bacterium]
MRVSKPPKGGTRTAADAAGGGRREALGVRQLAGALLLCQTACLSPYRHPLPTRWGKQRPRERGRPRLHQPDDRSYDPFRSCKSCARMFTGWGRARMPALLPARWKKHRRSGARPSSAASTRQPILRPVSIMQILRPNVHRLEQRVCPHIGIRGVPPQTSAAAD